MELLHEPDGSVHFVHNGNAYLVKNSYKGQLFMTCVMASKCQASATIKQNAFHMIKEHCHIPDADKVSTIRFTKTLRIRAMEENRKIVVIYNHFLKTHPEAANHFKSVHNVKKGMGLARCYRPSPGFACLYNEPSGKIHCTFDSHIYRITKKYPMFCFARCSMASKCPGRAVIYKGCLRLTRAHNHKGSRRRLQRLRFLKELKCKSALSKDPLSRIFHLTSLKHPESSKGMTFSSVKHQMMRARLIKNMQLPYFWYIPLDHSKTYTGPQEISTPLVSTKKLQLSQQISQSLTNSMKVFQNSKHQTPVKPDSDNLLQGPKFNPQPVVQERNLPTSRAYHNKSAKIDPHGNNQSPVIPKVDPYANQPQILPNQSQILPPAQNLYFIMPQYYPPTTQLQKNEPVENVISSPDSGIKISTPRSDHHSEYKTPIKEEITHFDNPEVIDITNDFDSEGFKRTFDDNSLLNSNNMLLNADEVKNYIMQVETDMPEIEREGYSVLTPSDNLDANASTQTEAEPEVNRTHTDVVTETLLEMHKILKNLRTERNSSNEVFGKYVATSMGSMTKKNAQAARREILDVLNKYET